MAKSRKRVARPVRRTRTRTNYKKRSRNRRIRKSKKRGGGVFLNQTIF